jgi:hypothetical protein
VLEKGDEQEVELARVREVIDARITKANRLAFRIGEDGNVHVASNRDAHAVSVNSCPEFSSRVDMDDDAILVEGNAWIFGIDEAGGFRVAAKIIATVGAIEELSLEGALHGLGGDSDLSGVGRNGGK